MILKQYLLLFVLILPIGLIAQGNLPAYMTAEEKAELPFYDFHSFEEKGIETPPETPVRTMAEWEEIQSLVVTWTQYRPTLAEIIRHAKKETEVIVVTNNVANTQNQLLNQYDLPDLDNITFLDDDYNSIWMRDYGPNTVYENEVEDVAIVDWIYNRPRPLDDIIPDALGEMKGIPVYTTTAAPTDLVNTGGNFTADGLGTAFASTLILDENEPGNPYNATPKTEAEIDQIMSDFMGIDRYIKMETLPYDLIHHIDMHFKLLDEETILVGEYPNGVSDGPQIEANIAYVANNFMSSFGEPYEFVRIQMPPDGSQYPSQNGDYRTYTNSVFVNKTMLVPVYDPQYDEAALEIYREALPGYNVVGIDCNDIIESFGALHCITRAIGTDNPLWIVHQEHDDVTDFFNDYEIEAQIKHRDGVANATLYWTVDTTAGYAPIDMQLTDIETNIWTGYIPEQVENTEIFYYIHAEATTGKMQVRPLPAPAGYWDITVDFTTSTEEIAPVELQSIFPNPANAITCIPIFTEQQTRATIEVIDLMGKKIETVFSGELAGGETKFFIDAATYPSGVYLVRLSTDSQEVTQKLIIK